MCEASKGPSITKLYELAREQICHEDNLINHRITWYLVFQGLLFTATLAAVGILKVDSPPGFPALPWQIKALVVVLALLGMLSSVVVFLLVKAAYEHMADIKLWWNRHGETHVHPPLAGRGGRLLFGYHVTAADAAWAIALSWVVVLTALLSET